MKLIKVMFTEFRDPPGAAAGKTVSESDAAQQKLAELARRELAVRGDIAHAEDLLTKARSEQLAERLAGHVVELDNIYTARKSALEAARAAGESDAARLKEHARVGTFGYQVLDDAGAEVARLVDEAGKDLPAGAVYGYEVVDVKPDLPAWAQGERR